MTEEFSGLCAYTDGVKLKLAFVMKIEKKRARALISTGREIPLPIKNLIFSFTKNLSEDEFLQACSSMEEEISKFAKLVDLPMLWEMLSVDDQKTFHFNDLCELYYGECDDFEKAALFDNLCGDIVYFKRRGLDFTIREEEQIQAILRSQQKKKEKEAYESELGPWVESVLNSSEGECLQVPDKFSSFTGQLCNLVWHKTSSEASRFLNRFIGKAPLRLKAVEFLTKTGNISADLDKHLVMAGIHPSFSNKLEDLADNLKYSEDVDRKVLGKDFYCFSIDDDSTKDVDDVLSIQILDNDLLKVGVHIADVSAYVAKNSDLDLEATRRASSIYLPTGNVNMFPSKLSTEKFSLLPVGERPAVSFYITLTCDGEIKKFEVERSLIQVTEKLSYSYCDSILNGETCRDQNLKTCLELLNKLSHELFERRKAKGAFNFNRPENKIVIENSDVSIKEVRANSLSRALVGEFMILANNQAATYCRDKQIPILYRVQAKPDKPIITPEVYDPISFDKAVKCLKKSKMTLVPSSHAGLGMDCYTQFTSPIRRFTDLVMQRQLIAAFEGNDYLYSEDELSEILTKVESSLGEIREVQKQSEQFWIYTFLKQKKLGQYLEASVVAHVNGGMMIELDELTVRLKLNHSEKLPIGSKLQVQVEDVDPKLGHVKLAAKK